MNGSPPLHNGRVTERQRRAAGATAATILFLAGLFVLYGRLQEFHYQELQRGLAAIPRSRIALALGLTLLNYAVLAAYDGLAILYIGARLRFEKTALASFVAYAINNSAGFSGIFGGSVRLRLYRAWGIATADVARLIAFTTATFWVGFLAVTGMSFTLAPPEATRLALHVPRAAGLLILVVPVAYVLIAARRRAVAVRGHSIALPSARLASMQVILSSLDWLLAVAVLWILLPPSMPFARFASAFLLAQAAGLLSGLPGGIGVFETVIVVVLGGTFGAQTVVAALIVYRAVYYILPLLLACVMLAGYEVYRRRHFVRRAAAGATGALTFLTPYALAAATFVAGVVLLVSGATPPVHHRLSLAERLLTLPVVEASHLVASIIGAALLLVARGLQKRLNAAWFLAIGMLAAGSVLSLLKAFDYEEAIALAVVLVLLILSRRHFERPTLLIDEPFTAGWIAAIVAVIAASLWLGLFSYKHVEYSHDLWWKFSAHGGGASRFLRASIATITLLLLFALRKLFHPPAPELTVPTTEDLDRAARIARRSTSSESWLALTADKCLLFDATLDAFLMYGVNGRSWIAMSDPAGDHAAARDLAWKFREECHRHDAWPVFYEISNSMLPVVVDLGLTIYKIGEAARVQLPDLSLDGGAMKSHRRTLRKFRDEGWRVEVVRPPDVRALLPELRSISDEWLESKNTREKRFSLGWFDEDYLARCSVALARSGDEVVAFANLWESDTREELSIDLMRHRDSAPPGIMDYLFLELMLAGQSEGYRWFSLGMAPLSGLDARALGPLWNRVGALVFMHGEHFYNFQGLRQYKEKFRPEWEPRYIALPRGLALPRVLTNIATLVSGGVRGVVTK